MVSSLAATYRVTIDFIASMPFLNALSSDRPRIRPRTSSSAVLLSAMVFFWLSSPVALKRQIAERSALTLPSA